jgi:hypothetical protein
MSLLAAVMAQAKRRAFDPLSLSPALWLSDTGSDPAQWDDISGNGRHATQATPANQPSIESGALNGRQVRRFDVADNFECNGLASTFAKNDGAVSMFFVCKANSTTGSQQILFAAKDAGSSEFELFRVGSAFRYAKRDSALLTKIADSPITANTNWNIHSVINTGTSATVATNGNVSSSTDIDVGTLIGINGVRIGTDAAGGSFLTGDIAEILIFPTALSDADRQAVENYLNNKYAIY